MMNNKEQIAKWRADDETWSMASAAGATGEMLDMLEQQQEEIDRLTKDNERLENEVEDLVYLAMGEYV